MQFYKWILALALFFCIYRFCHHETRGFQIVKVQSTLPTTQEWEIDSKEERQKIENLLSQPFIFLGSGGQCYAFLSQDKKTVLKLYKMHHLCWFSWMQKMRFPLSLERWRLKFLQEQREKREKLFKSSHLAWVSLKEETGLIHLQLNPCPEDPFSVKIIDKIGIAHRLKLDKVPFALQEYAENPFQKLRSYLSQKDIESARSLVKEIIDTLVTRYKKQIQDTDPALRRNTGLLGNRIIFIDIGSFSTDPTRESIQQLLFKETRRMDRWLKKRSPELQAYLDKCINEQDLERDPQPLLPKSLQP